MLRVSYHGMLLAWGHVPTFCVCGGVANVEAKDEAVLLRDEVRALIQSEQHVVGKAEFDVEGEVAGLGYLHCKASCSKATLRRAPRAHAKFTTTNSLNFEASPPGSLTGRDESCLSALARCLDQSVSKQQICTPRLARLMYNIALLIEKRV
ncbi:hypothetical protein BDA96_01G009000 [Sorghum bicolor]|jgi:hypothetical protein|uniref:Uncharacterized protein n=2 Tax=Sorghum bicolor TaxID=4558 RepID=A0A921RVB7_SORBI|nr:hypothetical protein SORBI_3001G009000 [Sorghum bicolor]KAG0546605.1 hypothetical protein BDA96_01G009000 [Sorghum bicolor]